MNIKTIGYQLSDSYIERSERKNNLETIEREMYKRELVITPVEGWPGKNAEQRDLEKARALQADDIYQRLSETADRERNSLGLLGGIIEALEADRRANEWEIRANLVTVMAGKLRGETSPTVEDAAFDDAAGREMDDQVFGDLPEGYYADLEASEELNF